MHAQLFWQPTVAARAQTAPACRRRPAFLKPLRVSVVSPSGVDQKSDVFTSLVNYRYEEELPEGRLTIYPLRVEWLQQTAELLRDAYFHSQRYNGYKKFLARQILQYLESHISLPPKAVVLTAVLTPHSDQAAVLGAPAHEQVLSRDDVVVPSDSWQTPLLPKLVGSAEVSFHESTRSSFNTLTPPPDCAYLCNMAVAVSHQRKGYGLRLVAAAEALAQIAGKEEVYLHVRFQDQGAAALYERCGFTVQHSDVWPVVLLGWDRRHLLKKQLGSGSRQ